MKRWPIKLIGEVSETVMGQAPPGSDCNFDGIGTPFVKAGEFGESRPTIREWTTNPLKFAKRNDVLVCVVGATCGKLNLGTECAIGRSVAAIRPNAKFLDTGFLYAFLRGWTKRLRSGSQGSAQGVITRDMLARIPIPVPPLEEQERIVQLLEEAVTLRELRVQADRRTTAIIPALFHEIFGGLTTNHMRWPEMTLGELVKFVGGGTPSRANPAFFEGKIPWATSKDVKSDYIGDTQEHVTEEAIAKSATNLVPAGSVLIVVKSKILMHSLPLAITTTPMCFGQDLKGLICGSKTVPEFIFSSLRSQKGAILAQARGANTEGLTLDILRAVKILLPPLSLQKEFAQRVNEIMELQNYQAASRTRLDTLFHSLLHRAFNGEL